METLTTTEVQPSADPYAYFSQQLASYALGVRGHNSKQRLERFRATFSKHNEKHLLELIQAVADRCNVDLDKAKTSKKALEILMTD